MIRALIGAAIALPVLFLVLWVVSIRRAARSVAQQIGTPTPAEAKIEMQTANTAGKLAADGEAKAREVMSEDRKKLLSDFRARFFGKR